MLATDSIVAPNGVTTSGNTVGKAIVRVRLYAVMLTSDIFAIAGGMAVASVFRLDRALTWQTLNVLMVLLPLFVAIALSGQAYGLQVLQNWRLGMRRSLSALASTALIVVSIGFALKVSSEYSRIAIISGFAISAFMLISGRYLIDILCRWSFPSGAVEEIILCDGASFLPQRHTNILYATALGLKPVLDSPIMLDRIGKALRHADRVIVVCQPEMRRAWTIALKGLGINVEVLLPEVESLGVIGTGHYGDLLTAVVARGPLGMRERIIKRTFDLAVVFAVAPILFVMTAIVAVAIKLEDGGPVFFVQSRIGQGNRIFTLFKFRSMRVAELDAAGTLSTQRGDDRITRVGRFIRMTSIDELPQLFNVLLGDMSVVGPRPHALASTAADQLFWDVDERYWLRHAAKPGLTGLAQIRGFRGATSTAADLTNRIQADLEYLSGWTLLRDVHILFSTMRVLLHVNAY